MARDHRKLEAFLLADELFIMVSGASKRFPPDERYVLTSQLRRAALSAPTNIVEGAACRHEGQFVEHLNRSFGSLRETGYLLNVAW